MLIEHTNKLQLALCNSWEKARDREGSELTWPPTTAIEGSESHRVGNVLPSPWSPSAVQALWILFTKEIRFSISDRSWASHLGVRFRSTGSDGQRERSENLIPTHRERRRERERERESFACLCVWSLWIR